MQGSHSVPEINYLRFSTVHSLATGWTVRRSKLGRGEIFRTRPDRTWGTPRLPYNGYRVFPRGKCAGAWFSPPTPSRAKIKERIELYLYSPMRLRGLSRVNLTFTRRWWAVSFRTRPLYPDTHYIAGCVGPKDGCTLWKTPAGNRTSPKPCNYTDSKVDSNHAKWTRVQPHTVFTGTGWRCDSWLFHFCKDGSCSRSGATFVMSRRPVSRPFQVAAEPADCYRLQTWDRPPQNGR